MRRGNQKCKDTNWRSCMSQLPVTDMKVWTFIKTKPRFRLIPDTDRLFRSDQPVWSTGRCDSIHRHFKPQILHFVGLYSLKACNLQCFSLELMLVCNISSFWTRWHWTEEGQQGPAAHVAPVPPHRSVRPFCSLFISLVSAAALRKVKLLLSALLILNLQEPDGWQAGLRSSGLQDQSKTEINHRPYGDDNTCAESECVIQNNKSSAASPPASCWKWNHVGQTGEVNEILSRR